MKRHLEWLTQPDQTLKDRSRFWTWYMRGLHGDMDTRYEGDRRTATKSGPSGRSLYTSTEPSGFGFRPLASNTYGYHPKGVATTRRPDAGLAAQQALVNDSAPSVLDNKRPNWSTPMKSLDDVMLMREPIGPRSSSVPPARRSLLPVGSNLRHLPIDPALDDLLNLRTWSESRKASPEELDDAERSLNKLKTLIGYCRPYDKQCHEALAAMEKCLSGVEKAAMMQQQPSNNHDQKMVSFDPRSFE